MNDILTKEQAELKDLAQEIKAEHAKCRESLKDGLVHAVRVGELLIKAKTLCEHGEWGKWLAAHCDFSERMAQTYMRVTRGLPLLEESKAQRVADLSLRDAVQILTTPGATEEEKAAEFTRKFDAAHTKWAQIFTWCEQTLKNPESTTAELSTVHELAVEAENIFRELKFWCARELGRLLLTCLKCPNHREEGCEVKDCPMYPFAGDPAFKRRAKS